MRKTLATLLLVLVCSTGTVASTASPASANSHCLPDGWCLSIRTAEGEDLWYRPVNVYDPSTGITWTNSWEYWTERFGSMFCFGPICTAYAQSNWEWGVLGAPRGNVHLSHWGPTGPVYQQHFDFGLIRWHTNNACRCYNNGGYETYHQWPRY